MEKLKTVAEINGFVDYKQYRKELKYQQLREKLDIRSSYYIKMQNINREYKKETRSISILEAVSKALKIPNHDIVNISQDTHLCTHNLFPELEVSLNGILSNVSKIKSNYIVHKVIIDNSDVYYHRQLKPNIPVIDSYITWIASFNHCDMKIVEVSNSENYQELAYYVSLSELINNKNVLLKAPNDIFDMIPLNEEQKHMYRGKIAGVKFNV